MSDKPLEYFRDDELRGERKAKKIRTVNEQFPFQVLSTEIPAPSLKRDVTVMFLKRHRQDIGGVTHSYEAGDIHSIDSGLADGWSRNGICVLFENMKRPSDINNDYDYGFIVSVQQQSDTEGLLVKTWFCSLGRQKGVPDESQAEPESGIRGQGDPPSYPAAVYG